MIIPCIRFTFIVMALLINIDINFKKGYFMMRRIVLVALTVFCVQILSASELLGELGGFENYGGWKVSFEDGAEGTVNRMENTARSGKYSLKINKNNSLGYIKITTEKPLEAKAGTKYTFRGYFHSENAPVSSLLLFRVSENSSGNLVYDDIDRSFGFSSQSFIINTIHDHWMKRAIHYMPKKDKKVFLNVVQYGNPATVYLDDLEFTDNAYAPIHNHSKFGFPYTKEEVYKILEQRNPSSASFIIKDKHTVLQLNNKETPVVMYKGEPYRQYPDVHAYKDFGDAGIPLALRSVMISSYNKEAGVWAGKGKYRWDLLEKDLMLALQRNPNANLVLEMVAYHPYDSWSEENPNEIWQNSKGEKAYGFWGNLEGFTDDLKKVDKQGEKHWWYPSYYSLKWQEDTAEALSDIVKHIMSTPLGKAVVGFHIVGGHDGQFQTHIYDYSPAAAAAFHCWLKAKYTNIENLNSIWKTSYGKFEEIKIPDQEKNWIEGHRTPFITCCAESDYRHFLAESAWKLKDYFAGVVKRASGKPVFAGAYGMCTEYESWEMMNLKNLDYNSSAAWYAFRYPGYALGAKPESTFNLYGKMWIDELDLRTWTQHPHDEVYEMWISEAASDEMFKSVYRKMAGVSLAHGYGWWHYSMQHYFDDPLIMGQIAKAFKIAEKLQNMKKNEFRPDVCAVRTDYPNRFIAPGFGSGKFTSCMPFQEMMFETSGVPYDLHYLDDVLNKPELQNYKVYIFLHNIYLTKEQRNRIEKVLKNNGETLIWMYNTGYISENGKSTEDMSKLIGIKIETAEKFERGTPLLKENAPFTKAVNKFQGMEELFCTIMSLKDMNSFFARPQPFWIDDSSAIPIAEYRENGKVAMAVKKFDNWRSIYLGAPFSLGNDLLYNIAKDASAFIAGQPGQSIFMNGNFISIHALKGGNYTFRLPPGVKNVIDADTNKVLAKNVSEYAFYADPGKTYWFIME